MARAQKSYIAGSTSPSSFIQTACFFLCSGFMALTDSMTLVPWAKVSVAAPSVANVNDAKNAMRKNNFVMIFISSMYKDLPCSAQLFCEKMHVLGKTIVQNRNFF